MDCPVCREPMLVLELEGVEVDHCISCRGIWLDAGELELLLGDSDKKDELIGSFDNCGHSGERVLRCPICLKKMNKIICTVERKILIDRCPKNDGLWFDEGELHDIIQLAGFDGDSRVLELLGDMFGKKKNEGEQS
ncbi:MAG: zf-TFIIB domain-containing protein [Elusimicrobiota bacterium]